MKISTKKIKQLGAGVLMANAIFSAFAIPTNMGTTEKFSAEDFTTISAIEMDGGIDEVRSNIPIIELDGGQNRETYSLTPTQFTGGNTEITAKLDKIIMGSAQSGVQYEEHIFTQTYFDRGITPVYEIFPDIQLDRGRDASNFDFGTVELTDGTQEEFASSIMNIFPSGMHWQTSFTISDKNNNVLVSYDVDGSRTLNSIIDDLNGLGLGFTVVRTDGPILTAKANKIGELGNDEFSWKLNFLNINTETQDSADIPFSLSGGSDYKSASATVEITHGLADQADDDYLKLDNVPITLGDEELSKLEVATKIKNKINDDEDRTVDVEVIEDGSIIELKFTSIGSDSHQTRTLGTSNELYTYENARQARGDLTIKKGLAASARDHIIEINGNEIDLGTTALTNDEVAEIIRNTYYSDYSAYFKDSTIEFVSKTFSFDENIILPIQDNTYSSVNGEYATASFTVSKGLADSATDKTITIAGTDITLGDSGNSAKMIAKDIVDTIGLDNDCDYTASRDGAKVTLVAKSLGVDSSNVFGIDNDYTTVNEIKAISGTITITQGVTADSTGDRELKINGQTITLSNGELSNIQVRDEIVLKYGTTSGYTAIADGTNGIKFIQVIGMPDNSELFGVNDDNSYNVEDMSSATLTIDLTGISMPNNADENILNIDNHEFNLGTTALDTDGIGQAIVSEDTDLLNNFENLEVIYNTDSNKLTFTTEAQTDEENGFVLGSDLSFVTASLIAATASATISSTYSGESLDNVISTDNTIIIGGVTINFGTTVLDEVGITAVIKTALNTDSTFNTMYTVTTTDANLIFTASSGGVDNLKLTESNLDYTTTNEVKATGSLTIGSDLIENYEDKMLRIDSTDIDLNPNSEDSQTASELVTTISEADFNTVTTSLDETVISFKSTLTGSSGNEEDLVSYLSQGDNQYNGRYQLSEINLGDALEAGYTYEISVTVGDGETVTLSNIVTPQNSEDYTDFIQFVKTSLDNITGISVPESGVNGNTITLVADNVNEEFTITLTGQENTAPTATNVQVLGTPYQGETLTCDYTFEDFEGDAEDTENTQFKWYTDGVEINGAESETFTLTKNQANTHVTCEVTVASKTGVDIQSDEDETISPEVLTPLTVLNIEDRSMFSIPVCVDSTKSLENTVFDSNEDLFVSYTTGQWENFQGNFEPLKGYQYQGEKEFMLPLFASEECDFTSIKTYVNNDFNLLGLDSLNEQTAGEFLESLTLSSSTEQLINSIYDETGTVELGIYDKTSSEFKTSVQSNVHINPYLTYWITYNGNSGKNFVGVSDSNSNPFENQDK